MFEIGFSELVLIMLIALLVLGPERLPKLAADVGRWVGRARAMARQLRNQLDQEVNVEQMLNERPPAPPAPTPPPAAAAATATAATMTTTAPLPPDQDPDLVHHDQPDETLREPAPSTPVTAAATTPEPGNERPAA